MDLVSMLRMKDKIGQSVQDLISLDEKLMDMHGLGILDGYAYQFLVCLIQDMSPITAYFMVGKSVMKALPADFPEYVSFTNLY